MYPRPRPGQLPHIYTNLGIDYDERVLPSITNEVLKAVVAQFDAGELITQREMLSARVRYDDDDDNDDDNDDDDDDHMQVNFILLIIFGLFMMIEHH